MKSVESPAQQREHHPANRRGCVYVLQAHPAPAIIAIDPDSGEARTIFSVHGTPDGVQVDGPGNAIYWTNMGTFPPSGEVFSDPDGAIECCDLDGHNHEVLIDGGAIVTPKQMQLDASNGLIYWCDREGMAIFRCRTDGSALTPLLRTGRWPEDSDDVLRHCVGIALDVPNGYLYWTQKGPPDGGLGRIFRMGLDMPAGATPQNRNDVQLLLDNLPEPIDLEIDHERQQLYWTDRGKDADGGNTLNRADITATGLENPKVVAKDLKEGIGLALDLKQRRAFVADLSGAVRVVSMDGGTFTTIYRCAGLATGLAFRSTSS
ncbi:hypothetical protein EKH80_03240 [Dyella choica]|uniref:3-hydroxyacyl-CoA dehydrogenase n=1 Tax=Dyella choica TaxID=1927959 RepID=A0A3S0R624_9GAMM|nr:hypothetical protein EKH80_03240 [Dyella choica]